LKQGKWTIATGVAFRTL